MLFVLCLAVFALVFLAIIYRLYFHPLAAYPGPLLGRITDWYSVYHCLKGDRYLDFMELHNQYGDVVRYGPNRLSFSTVEALQVIYGSRANTKKSYWYDTMKFYMKVPSTHATTDKAQHARKRRILAQALSERMVHVYENEFRNILKNFLERYQKTPSQTEETWSPPFDMSHEFTLLCFDSMGQFCFGESFGSLQNPKKAEITENTLKGFWGLNAIGHMPVLSWLQLDALQSSTARSIKEYEAYAAQLATKCIERFGRKVRSNGKLSCVFDILYATSKQPNVEGFSLAELQSESSLLVTTGTDTTSGCLANTLFHLVHNPKTMFNLTKEIRKNFSDISEIRIGQTLNSCKLLTACVDESLRLSPIVGGCLMREVGPGGITVNGRVIPRGVDVGVPHHVIMRNPKYYDDPLEYNPQRWLPTETSNENLKVARAAFCPFGIGPTGCVGKAWALVEMKITLAQLLFQYDLQRAVVDNARDSSITQYLDHRERHSIDRFIITNSGPDIRFRLARRT